MLKRPLIICLLVIFATSLVTPDSRAAGRDEPLVSAIEAAITDSGLPFRLEVDCTTAKTSRSLRVYRGRVAAWNRERQVLLALDDREALLEMLQDAGFANFEARYGGRAKAEKEEAALRVSCRIELRLQGASKTSVQLADGNQSDELLGLAGRLLDHVEGLGEEGVAAGSLQEAITRLADASLAPELLELRLLHLPGDADDPPGYILRVDGGTLSRQRYEPGRLVGEPQLRPLTDCESARIIDDLNAARFWALPGNLRHDGLTEIEVGVLGNRKTVIARPSFRAGSDDAQGSFAALLSRLDTLPGECAGR